MIKNVEICSIPLDRIDMVNQDVSGLVSSFRNKALKRILPIIILGKDKKPMGFTNITHEVDNGILYIIADITLHSMDVNIYQYEFNYGGLSSVNGLTEITEIYLIKKETANESE